VTATCTKLACTTVVADPTSCTGQCDGFVTKDGAVCFNQLKTGKKCGCDDPKTQCERGLTCKDNVCKPLITPALPAGVADGTPLCLRLSGSGCCGNGNVCGDGEVCNKDQCVAASTCIVVTKPPQPLPVCAASSCGADEYCVEDPKQCVTTPCPQFKCVAAKKCGCDDPTTVCERGLTCSSNKCVPLVRTPLPPGVADGTPLCLRLGGSGCCGNGNVCGDGEVCNKDQCVAASTCASSKDRCLPNPCADGEYCEDSGQVKCIKSQKCGCANPTAKCGSGQTCRDNLCVPLRRTPLPSGVLDGTPLCLRSGQECCGNGGVCTDGQVCEKNTCVAASACSTTTPTGQPPAGACLTCATLPAGVTKFFTGCNTCECGQDGFASCTTKACAEGVPDPKSCAQRCDGALTTEDAKCGVCTCMGGKRTKCSRCNSPDDIVAESNANAGAQTIVVSVVAIVLAFFVVAI
jgi:hypothetical protein